MLFGMNKLKQLEAVIDVENIWFRTTKIRLQIHSTQYWPAELYTIEAGKISYTIPVQLQDWDLILNKTTITLDMDILESTWCSAVTG